MSSFTKLVPEIIESSIWNEPAEIRVVWITMLAKKDQNHYVRGDARTISRLSNVSFEAAQKALEIFQQPDPTSHTPNNEGRRIKPADGGWIILNGEKYCEYGMREDKKHQWREQKRQQRAKLQQMSANVRKCPSNVPDNERNTLISLSSSSVLPEGMQGEPTLETFKAAGVRCVLPESECEACYHFYGKSHFLDRHNRLINVNHAVSSWKINWQAGTFNRGAKPLTPAQQSEDYSAI